MPSVLLAGNSGIPLVSGPYWSGRLGPVGGVQLKWSNQASGGAYISLSGGATLNSGGLLTGGLSGAMLDGMLMWPGDTYFIPKLALDINQSGSPLGIFAACDTAASGQGRLYFEAF